MANESASDKAILMVAFAKMDPVALAAALGTVWSVMIFLATTVLLLKGAPEGGQVGMHLGLLAVYLPGYDVTWAGGMVGAAYLWVIGAITGFILAVLWNLTHHIYVIVIVARAAWWKMLAD